MRVVVMRVMMVRVQRLAWELRCVLVLELVLQLSRIPDTSLLLTPCNCRYRLEV
jgi:hypothetical protein